MNEPPVRWCSGIWGQKWGLLAIKVLKRPAGWPPGIAIAAPSAIPSLLDRQPQLFVVYLITITQEPNQRGGIHATANPPTALLPSLSPNTDAMLQVLSFSTPCKIQPTMHSLLWDACSYLTYYLPYHKKCPHNHHTIRTSNSKLPSTLPTPTGHQSPHSLLQGQLTDPQTTFQGVSNALAGRQRYRIGYIQVRSNGMDVSPTIA